jgi:hypothetical protein
LPLHGRPYHPQTQGKEERFHRTLKAEALKGRVIRDTAHAQEVFDEFRDCYNHYRPHGALLLNTPDSRYERSQRRMADVLTDWEYGTEEKPLKVKSSGYITVRGQGYFLSEAFGGVVIAQRESSVAGYINLYYRDFRIARIDVEERVLVSRKIYRANEKD